MAYSSSHRPIYNDLSKQHLAMENNDITLDDFKILTATALAGVAIGYGLNRLMQ